MSQQATLHLKDIIAELVQKHPTAKAALQAADRIQPEQLNLVKRLDGLNDGKGRVSNVQVFYGLTGRPGFTVIVGLSVNFNNNGRLASYLGTKLIPWEGVYRDQDGVYRSHYGGVNMEFHPPQV